MTPALKEWLTQLLQVLSVLAQDNPQAQTMIANLKQELDSPVNWEQEKP
jgi:hypothetical protein